MARSTASLTRLPHVLYGADYNPEQWPAHVVDEDVAAMQEAGVNIVSLGIFAWAEIQPRPETYAFEWLDDVIARLHAGGIAVDLATPTASPPAWLVREDPGVLPVNIDGVRLWHGSRRHYCPHSPTYRRHAAGIARALAVRYGDHPALAMWHVDNEYACHVTECFCEASVAAFRVWLRARYGEIAALNAAWSTSFWGQRYGEWEEVNAPRRTPAFANAGQLLDWRRFWSSAWLEAYDEQAAILRAATPDIPITTNFMRFFPPLDYWTWAAHEDIVSDDYYPDTYEPDWQVEAAMIADLMRSLGRGRAWMRMEQATAHVNWRPRNPTKRPGVMRRGSLQAVARGAEGICFFQWRASPGGAERFHSAMLPHAGKETRTWREVVALGEELSRLDALVGSRAQADVALLYDWDNIWALEAPGLPSEELRSMADLSAWHAALFRRNVLVDFAHPADDLSAYRLVVAPTLHLVSEAGVERIRAFVAGGGTVVLTCFSGIADASDRIRPGGYPGPFREMLGLTVEEIVPFPAGHTNRITTVDGQTYAVHTWADVIRVEGADVVASYREDFHADGPAITRRRAAGGEAWYVGTQLEAAGMDWLAGKVCAAAGVPAGSTLVAAIPPGVEVVSRATDGRGWTFVLNHTAATVELPLRSRARELLSGLEAEISIRIAAGDVAILESEETRTSV